MRSLLLGSYKASYKRQRKAERKNLQAKAQDLPFHPDTFPSASCCLFGSYFLHARLEVSNVLGLECKTPAMSAYEDVGEPAKKRVCEGCPSLDGLRTSQDLEGLPTPQKLPSVPWAEEQPCVPSKAAWHATVWHTWQGLPASELDSLLSHEGKRLTNCWPVLLSQDTV